MERGGRRKTLSEQMANMKSLNLQELMRLREQEDSIPETQMQTLGSIVGFDKRPQQIAGSRTLFDIIREEEERSNVAYRVTGAGGNRIKWKGFKDRLRLLRSENPNSSAETLTRTENAPEAVAVDGSTGGTIADATPDPAPAVVISEPEPVRVSLLTLLEQTDRFSAPLVSSPESGTDDVRGDRDGEVDGGKFVCCVCMVRHKGAAFIPCGHAFCRLCSRELWISRGNCPLCNGCITEILDIF